MDVKVKCPYMPMTIWLIKTNELIAQLLGARVPRARRGSAVPISATSPKDNQPNPMGRIGGDGRTHQLPLKLLGALAPAIKLTMENDDDDLRASLLPVKCSGRTGWAGWRPSRIELDRSPSTLNQRCRCVGEGIPPEARSPSATKQWRRRRPERCPHNGGLNRENHDRDKG
jgi:hypothetical protein